MVPTKSIRRGGVSAEAMRDQAGFNQSRKAFQNISITWTHKDYFSVKDHPKSEIVDLILWKKTCNLVWSTFWWLQFLEPGLVLNRLNKEKIENPDKGSPEVYKFHLVSMFTSICTEHHDIDFREIRGNHLPTRKVTSRSNSWDEPPGCNMQPVGHWSLTVTWFVVLPFAPCSRFRVVKSDECEYWRRRETNREEEIAVQNEVHDWRMILGTPFGFKTAFLMETHNHEA